MAKMFLNIFKDKSSRYRVRLKANNGRIIMSSEAYYSLSNAKRLAKKLGHDFNLPIKTSIIRKTKGGVEW